MQKASNAGRETSRIFLLETLSPSQKGGHADLLQQNLRQLKFVSLAPQTSVFLCNSIVVQSFGLLVIIPVALFCPSFSPVPHEPALPC